MAEVGAEVGQAVSAIVLETGEEVTGMYLGEYWWNRAMSRCERALVRVNDREVTCLADSVEVLPDGG